MWKSNHARKIPSVRKLVIAYSLPNNKKVCFFLSWKHFQHDTCHLLGKLQWYINYTQQNLPLPLNLYWVISIEECAKLIFKIKNSCIIKVFTNNDNHRTNITLKIVRVDGRLRLNRGWINAWSSGYGRVAGAETCLYLKLVFISNAF